MPRALEGAEGVGDWKTRASEERAIPRWSGRRARTTTRFLPGERTMHVASSAATPSPVTQLKPTAGGESSPLVSTDPRLAQYKVIRRNGAVVGFEPSKIAIALTKAFLAVNGGQSAASARVRELTAHLTELVVAALMRRKPEGGAIHIEEIQDQVELALMRGGEHEVARAYVLYREKRAQERAQEKQKGAKGEAAPAAINVVEH